MYWPPTRLFPVHYGNDDHIVWTVAINANYDISSIDITVREHNRVVSGHLALYVRDPRCCWCVSVSKALESRDAPVVELVLISKGTKRALLSRHRKVMESMA